MVRNGILTTLLLVALLSDAQSDIQCSDDVVSEPKDSTVVVVVYASADQLRRAEHTIATIRYAGEYHGDIVFFYPLGDVSEASINAVLNCHHIIIQGFPAIHTPTWTNPYYESKRLPEGGAWRYHMKFRIFDTFFLQWDRVLYVDAGTTVFKPLRHILKINCTGALVAHSDSWPDFSWRLSRMFHPTQYPEKYAELIAKYGSLEKDYFASSLMYFDSKAAIAEGIVDTLYGFVFAYPNGHGDQAYITLMYCHINPIYKMIEHETNETIVYDLIPRSGPAEAHVAVKNAHFQIPSSWLCPIRSPLSK